MRAIQPRTFADRMKGVLTLDRSTYEEIGRDEHATVPAAAVVLVAALQFGLLAPDGGIEVALVIAVLALLTWLLFSALAFFVGTRYLAKSTTFATWESVLRGVGFASFPLLASSALFLPGTAGIALIGFFLVGIWAAVAIVAAIRYVMNLSVGGAIITAATAALGIWVLRTVLGWLLVLIVGFS